MRVILGNRLGKSRARNKTALAKSCFAAVGTPGVCTARIDVGCEDCTEKEAISCPWDKVTNRSDFDLVVWNTGLHHLVRDPKAAKSEASFTRHLDLLRKCARSARAAFPKALLVYKLTNMICSAQFTGELAADVKEWGQATEIQPRLYNMQFDEIGVRSLHVAERVVASEFGMQLLDTHTEGMCDCTGITHGRHYPVLIPHFVVRLHRLLNRST